MAPGEYARAGQRLDSTAARDHALRVAGLYALEERVFSEVGLPRPKDGRWDLLFRTFVLMLLLLFSVFFAGLALVVAMSWEVILYVTSGEATLEVTSKAPGDVVWILPEVH